MSVEIPLNGAGLKRFGHAGLPKKQRLRYGSDFEYVKKNGVKKAGNYLILLIAPPRSTKLKYGFICSKKFDKKAVVRNRAKRIMKEVFRNSKAGISPCEIIFIPRRNLLDANIENIQTELIKLLKETEKWNM